MLHTLTQQLPPVAVAAWTSVQLEQAVLPDIGPWSGTATLTLVADADPSQPTPLDLVFDSALDAGYYRLTWHGPGGAMAGPQQPVWNAVWAPSVIDVATLIPVRTAVLGGRRAGTFTAETTPTLAEAERIIAASALSVEAQLGEAIPAVAYGIARTTIARRAAIDIETGLFPEQVSPGSGPVKTMQGFYEADLAALKAAVIAAAAGGSEEFGADASGIASLPTFSAPCAEPWEW